MPFLCIKVSPSIMGALTSNRKRGDDYFTSSSPIEQQLYGHIQKKQKVSVSISQSKPEYSVARRLSRYPESKPVLSRVHAPVRNRRFGFFSCTQKLLFRGDCKGNSAGKMGNIIGRYEKAKDSALKTIRYFSKEDDSKEDEAYVWKEKENEVIEIDDGEEETQDGVTDDSSIKDVDIVRGREGRRSLKSSLNQKRKMVEKQVWSLNSSMVSDVSNANGKVYDVENRGVLMFLDKKQDDTGVRLYRRLYDSTKKRDDKLNRLRFDIELNESRVQGYQSLRSHGKAKQVKKDWAEECFMPLTKEEEDEIARALHNSNRRKVLVTHETSNIDIVGEKLQCLKPKAWLNDEVINVYLELLKEREKREPQKFLKCHFFNTFFYKKLISGKDGYNFQSVRRWTTQKKLRYSLLDCDKIFVPIHQQIHWCLAIINKKEQKFQYLDSLKGVDRQVIDVLARYYVNEVKDKSGKDIDVSFWEQEFVEDLPEQENGFDCGMFMIKYADFYSRDIGLCFTQEHMPYFRRRTVKEILKLRAE